MQEVDSALERAMKHIVMGVSSSVGEAFFASLAEHLARALEVDMAMVGELLPGDAPQIQTMAVFFDGQPRPDFRYLLAGSPCEEVISSGDCAFPQGVYARFPEDEALAWKGIEGYVGTCLRDSAGAPIGLIAVLHRQALGNTALAQSILQIFAVRAAAELERKRNEKRLVHQAYHDPLTALPNRSRFIDLAQQALESRGPGKVAVLFIDLDNFKVINDSLGHILGDRLLGHVAQRLRTGLDARHTLARLGGDEFAVLIDGLARDGECDEAAAAVRHSLASPFVIDGQEVFVGASVGVAVAEPEDRLPTDLLRKADMALYEAKAHGKGQYAVFDPQLDAQSMRRLELGRDLRRAVERREFVLHYQPIVDLVTGQAVAFEALVRWEHPERGLVAPAEFIPLAEETGLIIPLGEWVLREACQQMKRWIDLCPSCELRRMAVNLSARQFLQPGLADTVVDALRQAGLQPSHLQLEITENVMMSDAETTQALLQSLRQQGIRFALDDFGTGYSSLSYLKRFPLDTLKIDRSFVDGLGRDPQSLAIVRAVIALGSALGLQITGEGVETTEQGDWLRELGCQTGQGYLFARPMAPDAIAAYLKAVR